MPTLKHLRGHRPRKSKKMETSVQPVAAKRSGQTTASMIVDDYRKGYAVPEIPYQEYGIVVKELWTRYNSVLRIIPGNDGTALFPQNINITEYSEDQDPRQYLSNTFHMCTTMTGFGDRKAGLIIDLPPGSMDRDNFEVSPLQYFYNIVASAVKNPTRSRFRPIPAWNAWVDNKTGTLPYPKYTLLFQALAFQINDRGFSKADGSPLVDERGNGLPLYTLIALTHKVSWMALAKALVDPLDPGQPLNPSANNKYGALAEAVGNLLYLNSAAQQGAGARSGQPPRYLRPSVQPADSAGWTKTPYNIPEEFCMAAWVPWGKLLRFYSASEQLQLIAAEFGADTVNYIFTDNSTFPSIDIPDNIRAAGLGRYSEQGVHKSASVTQAPAMSSMASPVTAVPSATVAQPAAAPTVNTAPRIGSLQAARSVAARHGFATNPAVPSVPSAPAVANEPKGNDAPPWETSPANQSVDKKALAEELERMRNGMGLQSQASSQGQPEMTAAQMAEALLSDLEDPEDA